MADAPEEKPTLSARVLMAIYLVVAMAMAFALLKAIVWVDHLR